MPNLSKIDFGYVCGRWAHVNVKCSVLHNAKHSASLLHRYMQIQIQTCITGIKYMYVQPVSCR